ncbi:MAG: hypothetical protein WEB90_05380 [Gemmatimonadota bacterium]
MPDSMRSSARPSGRSHPSARNAALAVVLPLLAAACGPQRLAVLGPVAEPEAAANALRSGTELEEPLRIVFDWQLNEGGQRVRGQGVARVEPPYHARLDLFLDNGETVISAAMVDGDLRLPPGAPDDILPPPDLMWGALGVFRPHDGTRLLGGDRLEGEAVRLRYGYADGTELHYEVLAGVLRSLELVDRGRVVQRVELAPEAGDRYPVGATYRNVADFRELRLERTSLVVVGPFDPDIWDPRS